MIEVRYLNKIINKLSVIYARLINQYKFKYQAVFSARLDKQDEDNQVLDETDLFISLNINQKLSESYLDNSDFFISIRTSNTTTRDERFQMEIC